MAKIIDERWKINKGVECKQQNREEIEKQEREEEVYRNEIKEAELINILEKELPKIYCFEKTITGNFYIGLKSFKQFLINMRKKNLPISPKQRIASVQIYRNSSFLDDKISIYEENSLFVEATKSIAKEYEKIKGREMTIRLAWQYQ